ncbi:alpha-N-arabinofuranosidase [Catalinimonas alkaloidigena]|uniref:non-reducing end alpha-L-arabinofuranosidase n=1 Tax=Catalinimonas alkaloidigena TaxID=1075417 RepID=A0A1G9S6N7_9BACT|nr:alpha-N-arabinofuranosidase [Catalinimonas alkaloidigena]SDM31051.1 alpha-N-arabinofuranosidase [Catalinimonas alkaloidigena]
MKRICYTLGLLIGVLSSAWAQNRVVVNADLAKDTISRHIYGHFAEHLGRCIYGGFYVGEDSDIPNTNGMRNDVVAALKKMGVPNLRWPGGCFADTYHWKDGIGPKEDRPSMINIFWGGTTEDNSFGTHEFMELCQQLGAEPFINGNLGSGTVQEMVEWVEYLNHPGGAPMAKLRSENGREQPWNVQFFGIGNENWGCGGDMTAEYYADVYKRYNNYIRDYGGPRLFRLPSTANSADYHWTETLMKNVPLHTMSGLGFHHYSVINWSDKGSATNFSTEEYFQTMEKALQMEELIQRHGAIMDRYDPKKRLAMVVDEWGGWYDVEPGTNPGFLYQQNTMRDAMIAGATLNIFNNHADRVRLANIAQTVNVLQAVALTDGNKMLLTPTYHVFEMYNVHHDALMLPLTVETANFELNGRALPAVSASASKDQSGKIHITLTNIDPTKKQEVPINLRGMKASKVSGRVLASGKIQDYNTFDQPNKVQPTEFKGAKLKGETLTVSMPPASVVVLELQ